MVDAVLKVKWQPVFFSRKLGSKGLPDLRMPKTRQSNLRMAAPTLFNGNMKTRAFDIMTYSLKYDAENRLASVTWGKRQTVGLRIGS